MARVARIVSTARYLPEVEVTNADLKRRLPQAAEAVDKLEEATGIRRRWWAPESWSTSDLALPAARLALEWLAPEGGSTTGSPFEAGGEYRGATGLFRFTPQGIRRAVVVHRIERGEPVAVDW